MARYHINSKGEPGVCRAKLACPFGGDEAHFASKEEAREAYEVKSALLTANLEESQAAIEAQERVHEDLETALEEATARLRKGAASVEEVQALRAELKASTDALRATVHARLYWEKEAIEAGLMEKRERPLLTDAAKRENAKYRKTIKTKRTFKMPMSEETYRCLVNEFTAWSGLEREEAKRLLRAYDEESGLTRDEYVTGLFQTHYDTTRDRVYLDLETTSFHPTTGEIIEIGIVRVNPQGEVVATVDERFDMEDKHFRDHVGTGPVDVHKIAPEDIRGKATFRDPEVQARLGEHLNDPDVILVAHNANFENAWLNHNLDGYQELHDPNSAENIAGKRAAARIQDTRNLAMFLGHNLPNTKLESFTQGNGVAYVDSHSAFPDAEMTWKALTAFQKNVAAAPRGQRPS